MPQSLILSVGFNGQLLQAREALLRSAGYAVHTEVDLANALCVVKSGDFDLMILCHTISDEDRWRLISDTRIFKPSVLALMLRLDAQPDLAGGASVQSLDGQHALLDAVMRLLATDRNIPTRAEQKRIFHIAYYDGLLKTRTALLEQSGYAVTSALGNEQARAAGEDLLRKIDLVVIGFSGSREQRGTIIRWVKEHCARAPVLALQKHVSESIEGADAVALADYPDTWLSAVASMVRNGS